MTRILQIDAFTDRPFRGNPAAVCLLEAPASEIWMQNVAAEMNLSETAFVHKTADGFGLRWFTPLVEVDLCGHATLATAHALWEEEIAGREQTLRFESRSGILTATSVPESNAIRLDFPATPPQPYEAPPELLSAFDLTPTYVGRSTYDAILVVDAEAQVLDLAPDFRRLAQVPLRGVIVTARSTRQEYDFISRFFAPATGVDEDPVTGSAHCCLAPYWSEVLQRRELVAFQASPRGGVVRTNVVEDRVQLTGRAVTVLRGELTQ